MSIIIEGPDGAGKTTLARYMARVLELPLVHGGGPPKDESELRRRMAQPINMNAVYDRNAVVSEQVYGQLRGGTLVDQNVFDHYINVMHDSWTVFVYCRPGDDILTSRLETNLSVEKNWKSADHVDLVRLNYDMIVKIYDEVFARIERLGVVVLRYDYTKGGTPCAG